MRLVGSAVAVVLAGAALLAPRPAEAIPVFAHRYALTCQACHTAVPHLTAFGETFLANGYRLPARAPGRPFPAALKVNLQYGGDRDAGGLPKAVVDEVEVLLGGSLGPRGRGAYFAEQYVVDGGLPGRSRDLWAAWRVTPERGMLPVWLRGGQFTLDLPVDPETFRETTDHYAIWDATAGDNPFALFAPKTGLMASAGSAEHGLSGSVAALQGHEAGGGVAARGVDRHLFVQQAFARVALSAYRYDGARPVDGADDRFWREGYGVGFEGRRLRLDAVYQRGYDAHASPAGGLRSSGAFAQVRYEISPRAFALARYDATQATRFARAATAGAGYRVARNMRLTVFDTLHRDADDGSRRNTLSTALLFAY